MDIQLALIEDFEGGTNEIAENLVPQSKSIMSNLDSYTKKTLNYMVEHFKC